MANGVQIGALHISLSAESTAFDRGMAQAPATAQDAMNDVTAVTEDASNTIQSQALAIGAALAAAFAIDGIKDRIKEQIDYADGLADVAARSNQTAEALSAMEYALHFSDATLQDYTGGLQKLSENMVAAAEGSKAQADLFDVLGISVRDQNGAMRNAADVMMDVSDELAKMEQGATQSNVAIDLLGKSAGPALLPALQQGSGAIQELTDKAAKLNLVVGTDASNAAGTFNDAIDNMKFATTGLWQQIATELIPVLSDLAAKSESIATSSGSSFAKDVGAVISGTIKSFMTIYKVVDIVATGIEQKMGKALAIVRLGLQAAVENPFGAQPAWKALEAVWADNTAEEKYNKGITELIQIWTGVGAAATDAKSANDEFFESTLLWLEAQNKYENTLAIEKSRRAAQEKEDKKNKEAKPSVLQNKKAIDPNTEFFNTVDSELVAMDAAKVYENNAKNENEIAANDAFFALVDSELVAMDAANVYKLNAQQEFNNSWLLLDQDRINKVVTNGDVELEAKKAQMAANVSFFQNGLNSMAQGQSKAAKAAQAIQKAQALYEIGVNTYRAATGAYAALAPIPFIGPALGVAAAGLAIAFGASMAQGVLSGSSPSSVAGGAPSALSSSNDVVPRSEQRAQELADTNVTYIRVPEDRMLSGRQLIDFIDEVRADGKEFKDLRFIAA